VFPEIAKSAATQSRGFCNKKRGEENEKEEIESFDNIVSGKCE